MQLVMPEFMSEHGFDFLGCECAEQGIEEYDAFVPAKPGEICVAMGGPSRAVHDEYAVGSEAASREQRLDALGERLICERREFIEQRGKDRGPCPSHEQAETQ